MYNLTVDEAHTFFVGDGQWLVHNCPPADGGFRYYMDLDGKLLNAPSSEMPLKLGYDRNLKEYKSKIPGVDWFNNAALDRTGLVSLETTNNYLKYRFDEKYLPRTNNLAWRIQILEAMKNTDSINFIVDGMDIFGNPNRFKVFKHTHWEMDQVLQRGYVNKLYLWEGGAEILDQSRLDWILQWKLIRGLR